MRVSGVVVLFEYPESEGEDAVQTQVNFVLSEKGEMFMLVNTESQIDLTLVSCVGRGRGITATLVLVTFPLQDPAVGVTK